MPDLQFHNQNNLFQLALGITQPWQVKDVVFSQEEGRLDIYLDYKKGTKFPCPLCQQLAGVYDTVERTWRHLNFFQYRAYMHSRLPRIKCSICKGIKNVSVPWARPNSGFTLLFEAFSMELAQAMPLSVAAGIVNEYDKRLMRIAKHYVEEARQKVDMSKVRVIGIDETSKSQGLDYLTVFIDILMSRVLFATAGRDSSSVERFVDDLKKHQGDPNSIKQACADLSRAFKKGIREHLPWTEIVFDRFHVMKLVNKALDKVRKEEQKDNPLLKGTRYAWLHNPENTTEVQTEQLKSLTKLNLKTAKAYQIRLALRDVYEIRDFREAEIALGKWYFWATHSRIKPVVKVAKTIKEHWSGISAFFQSRISNGLAEGINSIIQTIKRRARGYQNTDNFITMIYLNCSKLDFNLPKLCGSNPQLTHYK